MVPRRDSVVYELLWRRIIGSFLDIAAESAYSFWRKLWYPALLIRFITIWLYDCSMVWRSNRNKVSWAIVAIGATANAAAIGFNNGRMPVFGVTGRFRGIHKKGNRKSRLRFLCDIYKGPDGSMFSLGDVIITIGEMVMLVVLLSEVVSRIKRAAKRELANV